MKYKLRPSGSARWLACPASLVLEDSVPPEKRDDQHAAYLGSAAHELLEMCIKQQKRAEAFRGEFITVFDEEQQNFPYTKQVDETMIATANFFIDEVGEPIEGSEVYSELEMEHSELPELRGTADYVCINGEHALLADLKNGTGIVQVQKRDGTINTQLLSYAAMIFDKFPDVQTVTLAIIQPNGKTKKKVRSTGINRETSDLHLTRVKEAAKLADEATEGNLNVITNEGSWCWFCRAKDICTVKSEKELKKDFG